MKLQAQFAARGLPKVAMHGAELVCEPLSVATEVDALSPRSVVGQEWLDELAFVNKRREAIARLHPGKGDEATAMRAKFGLHRCSSARRVRPAAPPRS